MVNIGELIKKDLPHSYLDLPTEEIIKMCYEKMKINFSNAMQPGIGVQSEYRAAVRRILDSESPLIVAPDGSFTTDGKYRNCTAAFVACRLKIAEHESICNNMWGDRSMEPMIARVMTFPQRIGIEPADISHGEGMALWLQEASFDGNIPRGIISDSEAVRNCILSVRNNATKDVNRKFIRKDSAGISKCIIGAFRKAYQDSIKELEGGTEGNWKKLNEGNMIKNKIWVKTLYLRLLIFNQQSEKWISQKDNTLHEKEDTTWPRKYWDDHEYRPIIKINSHQLNDSGTQQKSSPRYKNLVPKLAPLNANHWADVCAGMPQKQATDHELLRMPVDLPRLAQRFFLTWGGMTLDKDVASRLRKIFLTEKVKRLRNKPTQGLLWRLMGSMQTTWHTLSRHKGWRRSLAGFSNTHSRAIYKSLLYRNGNWLTSHSTPLEEVKEVEKINTSLKCNWCNCQQDAQTCGKYGHRIKGNRTHHLFFCQHHRISRFRGRMDRLIENNLHKLIQTIMDADGISGASVFLRQINDAFIRLDATNTGRLERPPSSEKYVRSIDGWVKKLQVKSIMSGITEGRISYQHLFGMKPTASEDGLADCFIGASEAMLFGLVPRQIQKVIESTSSFRTCTGIPMEAKKALLKQMISQWEIIQQLMIAKAGGLHRIFGVICKEREKHWKAEFKENLLLQSFQAIKQVKRNANSEAQKDQVTKEEPKRKKAKSNDNCIQKRCYGISCRRQTETMGTLQQAPNQIPLGKRQCQRCDKKQAAMKVGAINLHELATRLEPEQGDRALHIIKDEYFFRKSYYINTYNIP